MRGRADEAAQLMSARLTELLRFEQSDEVRRQLQLSQQLTDFRVAARSGSVTPAQLADATARTTRFIAGVPAAEQASLRQRMARPILVAAAALGDTAVARGWGETHGTDSLLALEAAAAATAGDRAKATRSWPAPRATPVPTPTWSLPWA